MKTIIERGASWTLDETKMLLALWGQDFVQRQASNTKRTKETYEKISEKFIQNGYERTAEQVRTRVFNMIAEYRRILKDNNPERMKKCIFFEALHRIYQAKHMDDVKSALDDYEPDYPYSPASNTIMSERGDESMLSDSEANNDASEMGTNTNNNNNHSISNNNDNTITETGSNSNNNNNNNEDSNDKESALQNTNQTNNNGTSQSNNAASFTGPPSNKKLKVEKNSNASSDQSSSTSNINSNNTTASNNQQPATQIQAFFTYQGTSASAPSTSASTSISNTSNAQPVATTNNSNNSSSSTSKPDSHSKQNSKSSSSSSSAANTASSSSSTVSAKANQAASQRHQSLLLPTATGATSSTPISKSNTTATAGTNNIYMNLNSTKLPIIRTNQLIGNGNEATINGTAAGATRIPTTAAITSHQLYQAPVNTFDVTSSALLIDRMFAHLSRESENMREWIALEKERLALERIRRQQESEREVRRDKILIDTLMRFQEQWLSFISRLDPRIVENSSDEQPELRLPPKDAAATSSAPTTATTTSTPTSDQTSQNTQTSTAQSTNSSSSTSQS